MRLRLKAPSKTFLVGEYAVLDGGKSLLASTGPHFEMHIESPGEGLAGGIHPNSPAGRWVRSHPQDFNSVKMSFVDPYGGAGGFGASGAQFLFVHLWSQMQSQNLQQLLQNLSVKKAWEDFQSFYLDLAPRQRPSGADIVSQWKGRFTLFESKNFSTQSLDWPFQNLEFALVRTNEKMTTHTHLQELGLKNFTGLKTIAAESAQAFLVADEEAFLSSLTRYAQELSKLNLVAFPTQELLGKIKGHSSVLMAKGCGAMGADVMAVFYRPSHRLEIQSFIQSLGLNVTSSLADLSEGLRLSVEMNPSESRLSELGQGS